MSQQHGITLLQPQSVPNERPFQLPYLFRKQRVRSAQVPRAEGSAVPDNTHTVPEVVSRTRPHRAGAANILDNNDPPQPTTTVVQVRFKRSYWCQQGGSCSLYAMDAFGVNSQCVVHFAVLFGATTETAFAALTRIGSQTCSLVAGWVQRLRLSTCR